MSDNIKKLFLDAENREIKYGDSSDLPQLALDTATNEIKYTPEGSTLPEGVLPMEIDLDTGEFAYGETEPPVTDGWYGVEVDESNTDPAAAVTRIASDMTLHASLPIQSGMRRCVMGTYGVNYYLDAADSTLRADGTPAVLDGTDGDVMVEIPEHWVLVTKENTTLTVKLATAEGILEGAQRVPLHYISAYQATINDNLMQSASGVGATGNLDIGKFRLAADSKNPKGARFWSQMTYDYAVDLYWLFLVEYANRNSQAAVNNSLTPEGYRQGGLGMGCTYVDSISNYPAVNNGVTNSLGNNSGEISGVTPLSGSGTATVNSYRGIENPFGNLYTFYDGIVNIFGNIYRAADIADYKSFFYEATDTTTMDYAGGEVIVTPDGNNGYLYYLCIAPSTTGDKLSDDTKFETTDMATLGYTLDATYTSDKFSGYMSAVNNGNLPLGSILASAVDGTESTGYCDYSDVPAGSLLCVYGGGFAYVSAGGAPYFGLACVIASGSAFGLASASFGSRLCYTNAE